MEADAPGQSGTLYDRLYRGGYRKKLGALDRARLDALGDLNRIRQAKTGDPEIASRIAAYELAYRMQSAAPELLDFSGESKATRAMYGLDNKTTKAFGTNCLLARRMIERGVRFVQVTHSDSKVQWDQHGNLRKGHTEKASEVDKPIAGLLHDLKAPLIASLSR